MCKCSNPSLHCSRHCLWLGVTPGAVGQLSIQSKPLIFHEGIFCSSTLAAGRTGPWDTAVFPASPGAPNWDLGVSQVIKTSSMESLNSLFPCLGKQELLWPCYRGVCRSACLKSLQTWLWIPTEQTFPFPAQLLFPWSVRRGRGGKWSLVPSRAHHGWRFWGETGSSLPNHFTSTASPDCLCCRDWQRERLRNKGGTSPHIPHTNICHSSRNKTAN